MRLAAAFARIGLPPVGTLLLSGCLGLFAGDGSGVSVGSHSRGALVHGSAIPFEGTGYLVHRDWRLRDHRYGTQEMVAWLISLFAEVNRAHPDTVVYLGDLSGRQGGDVAKHRSHASGRDVDVFFVASDAAGKTLRDLPAMIHFARDGRALRWSCANNGQLTREPLPPARFDVKRNWAIVRAMLSSPVVEVQWIFIDEAFAQLLLEEAGRDGTPSAIVDKARAILHQPTDSQPHDDHMHVRVFCSPGDRAFGCTDKGPRRWLKKHWKYMSSGTAIANIAQ